MSFERITGERVLSAAFRVERRSRTALLWIGLGVLLVGGVIWLRLRRRPTLPPASPLPPVTPSIGGAALLIVMLAGAITAGNQAIVQAANPVTYQPVAREVFLPPGRTNTETPEEYRHPFYRLASGGTPADVQGTVGEISLVERLASDWKQLHPEEYVSFGYIQEAEHVPGHDLMVLITRDTDDVTHILSNEVSLPTYNHRTACELATLIHELVGDPHHAITLFKVPGGPDGTAQYPRIPNLTYSESEGWDRGWGIGIRRDYQGPPVGSTDLQGIRNACARF